MKKVFLLAPCTALLFACGGGSGGGAAVTMQPGQWETTVQFNDIQVPGVPEEQVAMMRQQASRPQVQSQCITQAQAANPMGNMMGQQASGCNFTKNTFTGGTIDIAGTCSPPGQGQANLTMTGTYTATTINSQMRMEVRPGASVPGAPQSVTMAGTVTARRTGDCPGGNR